MEWECRECATTAPQRALRARGNVVFTFEPCGKQRKVRKALAGVDSDERLPGIPCMLSGAYLSTYGLPSLVASCTESGGIHMPYAGRILLFCH